MLLFRSLLSLSLALSLIVPVSSAAPAKGKKKAKAVHGTVTAVKASDSLKDTGTFTVKIAAKKKKKGAAAAEESKPEEKTFTISKETKFVKIVGKKKDKKEESLSFADVKTGSRVVVTADSDGKATKVVVQEAKKAKKNQ